MQRPLPSAPTRKVYTPLATLSVKPPDEAATAVATGAASSGASIPAYACTSVPSHEPLQEGSTECSLPVMVAAAPPRGTA